MLSNDDKLLELQEMVAMYENLNLNNEFIETLRHYTICLFEAGDINKIKDLF